VPSRSGRLCCMRHSTGDLTQVMQPPKHPLFERHLESRIGPRCLSGYRPKIWPWYAVTLVTIGYCAFSPVSYARGHSGGQGGGQSNQSQHGGRYLDPFYGPSYHGYGGYYDSDYWYTPTPEQKAAALPAIVISRSKRSGRRNTSSKTMRRN
jgi:hypothetical protein